MNGIFSGIFSCCSWQSTNKSNPADPSEPPIQQVMTKKSNLRVKTGRSESMESMSASAVLGPECGLTPMSVSFVNNTFSLTRTNLETDFERLTTALQEKAKEYQDICSAQAQYQPNHQTEISDHPNLHEQSFDASIALSKAELELAQANLDLFVGLHPEYQHLRDALKSEMEKGAKGV